MTEEMGTLKQRTEVFQIAEGELEKIHKGLLHFVKSIRGEGKLGGSVGVCIITLRKDGREKTRASSRGTNKH